MTCVEKKQYYGLSANSLKLIALLAMTIDHYAWVFIPRLSPLAATMHFIGRLTAPIMCFFLVEGFIHTRSRWRYALRLGFFAVLSQAPFSLFFSGKLRYDHLNMLYTLFICFSALWAWDTFPNYFLKLGAVFLLAWASTLGDWGIHALLFVFAFYFFRGHFGMQAFALMLITLSNTFNGLGAYALLLFLPLWKSGKLFFRILGGLILVAFSQFILNTVVTYPLYPLRWVLIPQLGMLFSIPFLACYRGRLGYSKLNLKWFFYLYYPAHLLIIYLLKVNTLFPGQLYYWP